jgi:hypothetical protein
MADNCVALKAIKLPVYIVARRDDKAILGHVDETILVTIEARNSISTLV